MHGTVKQDWNTAEIALARSKAQAESRVTFGAYRQHINPRMLHGWWQDLVAYELGMFWLQYKAGLRPKLLLQAPRQHGKSSLVIDFLSWIAGQDRNLKIIFSSFSDRLGLRANLRLQRIFASPHWLGVFQRPILQGGMMQNSKIIEFAGGEGFFRNTTVGGSVVGEGLDIGAVDDPIKGRAEASSQLTRDSVLNWLTDDFLSRLADHGAVLMIMTRWHIDDPAGRLIEAANDVRVCRYPALAEHDEEHRARGEPLFPEFKSAEFLAKQRAVMTLASWESIYQQTPIIVGGDMFPIHKAEIVPAAPASGKISGAVRYWDKAGTADGGAYTAGVLMVRGTDGLYTVVDVCRGQWSARSACEPAKWLP